MFKLITVEDVIQIPPQLFGLPRSAAIEHVINKSLADRVIPHHGLVIGVWDVLSAQDDRLVHTSGTTSTRVCFRLVVFAPYLGEAMFAHVGGSTPAGLLAHVDFFDVVWVRKQHLPKPTTFNSAESVWTWRPTFDDPDNPLEYFMDPGTESVVRVIAVEYDTTRFNKERPPHTATATNPRDQNAGRPLTLPALTSATAAAGKVEGALQPQQQRASHPMTVFASLYDEVYEDNQGLGDPAWWYEGDVEDEEEEAMGVEEDPHGDGGQGHADDAGAEHDTGEEYDEAEGNGEYMEETEYIANERGAAVEEDDPG